MRLHFLIPFVMASMAGPLAFAAPSTETSALKSGNYTLDKAHTSVIFNLSHLGFSHYFGRFNQMEGALVFDAEHPEKSALKVTVDTGSIDTNNPTLEGELKSSQWFDSAQFPQATFISTRVEQITPTTGKVYGELTLHGVTRPVALEVTFNGGGENPVKPEMTSLGFSAQTLINRSDFGISNYLPMVGDAVTLTIETEFFLEH